MVKMLLTLFFVLLFIVLRCGCLTIPPIPIVGVWVPRASRGWLLRILFVYWRSQGFIWPFLFPFVFQIISFLFSLAFWKITFDKLFRSFCHVWHITIVFMGLDVTTLTLGSWLNVECKGLWAKKMCSCVKQTLTNGRKCKRWSLMISKCIPILGVAFVWESQMFRTLL
jgi:hypothetical protein